MKKIVSAVLSVLMMMCSLNAFAAGGGVSICDDNGETLFTGSVSSHYLLLSSSGVVSAWGENTYGQCGTEPCDEVSEINYIDFESKVIKVAAGNGFSIALDENNTAWGWGDNRRFQLGISRPTAPGAPIQFSSPEKIAENIIDIAVGEDFSVLLNENGEILFSGMGHADTLKVFNLPDIDGQTPKIKFITANYDNIAAIGESNMVFCWRSDMQSAEVVELPDVDEVLAVALGKEHLIIRCLNGENVVFYAYGNNSEGQLGVPEAPEEAVPVLSIPYEENQKIKEFAGEYSTVIDVWDNLSPRDLVTEYRWGKDRYSVENEEAVDKITLTEPESYTIDYQTIAVGEKQSLGFNFITNNIIIFGDDGGLSEIPLIEPCDDIHTMYEYQYNDVEYHTYNVNFIKLNEETFYDENAENDKYLYWEFVGENQFRVKIKDFIKGAGNGYFNPSISTIMLGKNVTGENRDVGAYGPSIWNFDTGNEIFETDMSDVSHGNEDGTVILVSVIKKGLREDLPIDIPSDIDIFYEEPGEINENTKLGLYLYGLPNGTEAEISGISGNTFKIILSGNSTADMDYDSNLKLCYVRADGENDNGTVVGDYNLDDVIIQGGERSLNGFTVKVASNTPEILSISGKLTKGRENNKTISASISGGEFSNTLSAEGWSVLGLDGVEVKSVERIDGTKVDLTLSGNSTDKYSDAELKIQCAASEYSDSRMYDEESGEYTGEALTSENFITVTRQSRSSGNHSGNKVIAKPSASVTSGEVKKGTAVELLSTDDNVKIYYTTDKTKPTEQSTLYERAIEITKDTTIKFIAVSGTKKSAVQTAVYTVKGADICLKENADEIKYAEADGSRFYPDKAMSRYEVLKALNNLFDVENLNIKSEFTDVEDEYSALVDLFVGAEIIQGYPDNTFRGDEGITRAEFVKMLSVMLDIGENDETAFNDISGHWCEKYINGFAELELLHGYPDGSFKPDGIITKAEVITVLNRAAGKNTEDTEEAIFDDVPDSHWAYKDICAAVTDRGQN